MKAHADEDALVAADCPDGAGDVDLNLITPARKVLKRTRDIINEENLASSYKQKMQKAEQDLQMQMVAAMKL